MNLEETLKQIRKNIKRKNVLKKVDSTKQNEIEILYQKYLKSEDEKDLFNFVSKIMQEYEKLDIKEILLREISEDRVVLDYIIEEDLYVPFSISEIIANDLDLLKRVLSHKTNHFLMHCNEDMLLKMYNEDMTIIEYAFSVGIFEIYWIKKIKSKIIISLLEKYNKTELLKYACENVLFSKMENGKMVLDYLFENNYACKETVQNINHPIIYDYLVKYNRQDLMSELCEDILIKYSGGKRILELMLDSGIKPNLRSIYNETIAKILCKREEYELLSKCTEWVYKKRIPNLHETLFEFLLKKGIVCDDVISSIKYGYTSSEEYIAYIKKYNRVDILLDLPEKVLVEKIGKQSPILETIIKSGLRPKIDYYEQPKSLEILYRLKCYEELQKASIPLLKTTLPNNKKLYEELFEKGYTINLLYIEDEEIVKYIFDNKITYMYTKIVSSALLKQANENDTYLDILLQESETNGIDLSDLLIVSSDIIETAKLYLIFAKYDKQMYLGRLTKEKLLQGQDGNKLIDVMLSLDKKLTIEKVLSDDIKEEFEIAMIIKLHGYEQKDIKFESVTTKLEREYLTNRRFEYEAISLDEEGENLLQQLHDVMNDGKSDPYLIYSLVANYRHLLSINSKYADEILYLIEIKKEYPDFTFKYVKNNAFFSPAKDTIGLEDANIDTLNHETGHALLHYLTNKTIPEQFKSIIEKLRSDENILQRTKEYSDKYLEIRKLVEEEVEIMFMPKYDESITDEKLEEIKGFLEEEQIVNKQKYIKLGYDEDFIDFIFASTFTLEEYLEQDRRIKKKNMTDLILRTRYSAFIATGDFLDGISKGKFKGGILKDSNGEKIPPAYGHGIEYYSRGIDWIFEEMIANYSEIVKTENPSNGLEELKYYVGEELLNIIREYYDLNILQSQKYNIRSTMKL